jgi:hypothetical protein
MTMQVTMTQTRMGESGSLLNAGTTYSVSDSFGASLVGSGYATDTNGVLKPISTSFSPADQVAVKALVQRDGNTPPVPAVLDSYSADSGYTYTGTPASHALRATSEASPYSAGVEMVSAAASTTTMSIAKATTDPVTPSRLGTVAALVKVSGKKSGRVLTLNSDNVIFADSVSTPLFRDGWMWIAAHVSEFTNVAALTAAQTITPKVQVQLTGNDGVTTAAARYFLASAAGRPSVCLTFDDCTSDQYTVAYQLMKAAGLVGTMFVPSANVGGAGKVTVSQLLEMKEAGWAICADSTPDDSLTSTTTTTAVDGLNQVRDWLVSKGLAANGSENHGCWTMGTWNEANAAAFAAAGMETMRTTQGSMSGNNKHMIYDRFGVGSIAMTLPSMSAGAGGIGSSFAVAQSAIDLAILRGCQLTMHFHTFVDSGASGTQSNTSTFAEIVQYLAARKSAGAVDVLNRTEWWTRVKRSAAPMLTV